MKRRKRLIIAKIRRTKECSQREERNAEGRNTKGALSNEQE